MAVDLSLTRLLGRGKVSLDITYRYSPLKGTACSKQDLERLTALDLETAATGRLFYSYKRPAPAAKP
jgi:hypothetical protein